MSDNQTIVMSTSEFVVLLADTVRASGDDNDMPMIAGVLLHVDTHKNRTVLVAQATNRYVGIQAHAPVAGGTPGTRLWLSRRQITQLLLVLKPFTGRRSKPGQIEIAVDDSQCSIRQLELDGFAGVSVTFPFEAQKNFPNLPLLCSKDSPELQAEAVCIDPRWLTRMTQICRNGETLQIETRGKLKPVRFTVDDRLWAIVMPTRREAVLVAPVFELPSVETVAELAA